MRQRRSLISLFVVTLTLGFLLSLCIEPMQAQIDGPYAPSGILVSELGGTVPPGRLNVRFSSQDPRRVDEELRHLLHQPRPFSGRPLAAGSVPTITAEIQTLATGLEDDPLAIYDYVHNHVDYVPSWGLLKNPRETLLAGAGNAFDQAALLTALLDAAGFQTRYVWGNIRVSKTDATNWVGVTDPSVVGNVFASGGIPTTDEGNTLLLSHVWVEVYDTGTWRRLDPSFKTYTEQVGQDLRPLLGYSDLSGFVGDAEDGATITADYVQHLNQAQVRTNVVSYTLNLIDHLQSDGPFAYPEDLIGDRQIEPSESITYTSSLSYTVVTTSGQADEIPNGLAYTMTVQLPGLNYVANVDDVAGERITIFYECATPTDCQRLEDGGGIYNVYPAYQVNVVPVLRIGGEVAATSSVSVPLGTWGQALTMTIDTPSGDSFVTSQSLIAGEWYALPMRLQTVSNRALARHVGLLDEAMSQGLALDDERVLGQILYLLGLSYFNEVDLGDRIDSRIAEVVQLPHFSLMIASRNLVVWVDTLQRPVALDPASHTVDVRLSLDSVFSAQNPADDDRERAWFISAGMRGSAAEHAVLEQLQPVSAISTIQILNLSTEEGQRIYYITPSNWGTVSPNLGHSIPVLNSLVADLSGGRHIIISQDPITYDDWTGSAWISLDPDSGSAGYMISGNLGSTTMAAPLIISGGGGSRYQPPEDSSLLRHLVKTVEQEPRPERISNDELNTPDPIDVATGSFLYYHQDLAPLGGLGIPLGFERHYASSQHSLTSTLGYGWNHTYSTHFYTATDWVRGFGGRMALEAAPALASAQVGLDLFDLATIPHQRYGMEVTVAQWLMTQITGNAATLIEPDGNVAAHLLLTDGTYQPPTGGANLDGVTVAGDGSAVLDWEGGTRTHFDSDGRPTAFDDANGNRTMLSYDGEGRLVQVSDAVTRSLTFTYSSQGLLSQVADPAGRTNDYTYDAQGNLWTCSDPRGAVTTYTYDSNHRLIAITDPVSITYVTNQYDELGRVVVQTDGRGGRTELLYGGDHTCVTDPMGYRSTYFYDARTRLTDIEDALGNRTSIRYDAGDHVINRSDGLGQTFSFSYDAFGRLVASTDPLSHTVTWGYDATGNPISYTNQLDQTWQFAYDGEQNLTAVSNPLGATTVYTYDSRGRLTQARDPTGVSAAYSYDEHGNLACITNALGEASCWSYDAVGRPISFTNGAGHTTGFSYDAADNMVAMTDPLGQRTSYAYDAVGNLVVVTDPKGYTTTLAYDAQLNLVGVIDAMGGVTTYGYDANDGLTRITDANGHATTYQRDPSGRIIRMTDPLSRSVALSYDAGGRLAAFSRADGSQIGYQRDGLGRLIGIDYPTDPDIAYGYDAAGNLTSATFGSAWSADYAYDDAGRLTAVVDHGRNLTVTYGHDAAGRRTRLLVSRGATALYDLAYGYDAAARLIAITDQTGLPTATVGFRYDPTGYLVRIIDPGNGIADYAYDAAGRLTMLSHSDARGDSVAAYNYAYDANGNPTIITETIPATTFVTRYSYDSLNRLAAEIYPRYTTEYTYDPIGNLIRRIDPMGTLEYAYDDADQLQSRGTESFDYDLHGNLVTWQNARGTYSYTYSYENLLTDLALPDSTALAFTYDTFGRRLTAQGPAETRGFLHDGLAILLEGNSDLSQVTERYLYGNDLLVARYDDRIGFTAYHGDARENVRYLADGNGHPFDVYRFDAFGRPAEPAGVDPNPFRFVGQRSAYQHGIPAWPVVSMGYRDCDPDSGRFLSRDPLSGDLLRPGSLNDYSYALDNPIRYNDPTGLRSQEPPPKRVPTSGRGDVARASSPEGIPARQAPPQVVSSNSWSDAGAMADAIGLPTDQAPSKIPTRSLSQAEELADSGGKVLLASRPEDSLIPDWRKRRSVASTRTELFLEWLLQEELYLFRTLSKYGVGRVPNRVQSGTAHWIATFRPDSVFALACTSDDRLLGGAFQTGLFRSTDTGHATWGQVYTASVGEVTPVDLDTHYAGTWYDGVLKTDNGGDFWAPMNAGLSANDVYALAIDPSAPDHVFAGTEMGLFVSDDGGVSWGRPAGIPPGQLVSELAFADDVLLAVTDLGLYRSDDGGISWQAPATDPFPALVNVLHIGSPASTLYAGTTLGLYRSTDSGDTWASWGTGLADSDVRALAIDPADADHLVAGTTEGLFVSVDAGNTWAPDTYEGLDGIASEVGTLAFCPDGGKANLYLGAGGGVYALRTPVAPVSAMIDGPTIGGILAGYTFTVAVSPISTTRPLTYVWEATGQDVVTNAAVGSLTDTMIFTWSAPGIKTITVTASNSAGVTTTTHAITVGVPPTKVNISGPASGAIGASYGFTATVSPATATLPLTYTWEATGQDRVINANVDSLTDTESFVWTTSGVKAITLTVSSYAGMTTSTHTIAVSVSPAEVSINGPAVGAVGINYGFTATVGPSTAMPPFTYAWEAVGQSPVVNTDVYSLTDTATYTWHAPGLKTITLTVSNSVGMTRTTHTIAVGIPPTRVSISGPIAGAVGASYGFTATVHPISTTRPITYVWEATGQDTVIETGTSSLTDTLSFTWSTPGVKVITVTVRNDVGEVSTTHAITIGIPPAGLGVDGPVVGAIGTSYIFTAAVSPSTTTVPLTYVWNATDQDTVVISGISSLTNTISLSWATAGVKTITVTVSNGAGTATALHTIRVAVPPAAVDIVGPTAGVIDTRYDFTALVSPITATQPLTYVWKATKQMVVVHTGASSAADTASFTWSTSGEKNVTVTVSNDVGRASTTHAVFIADSPQPPTSVNIVGPAAGAINTYHSFTATVGPITTTQPITYIWEASDQGLVVNADVVDLTDTVTFAWRTPGIKAITLTVSNSAGMTSTAHTIAIQAPPATVNVTGPTTGTVNTIYDFTALVSPPTVTLPLSYVWKATGQSPVSGTGVSSLTHTALFTWSAAGGKAITVTVSNSAGQISTTHTITIYEESYVCLYLPIIMRNRTETPLPLDASRRGVRGAVHGDAGRIPYRTRNQMRR